MTVSVRAIPITAEQAREPVRARSKALAYLDADKSVDELRSATLGGGSNMDLGHDLLSVHNKSFAFWSRWFDAAERGAPLDFELQRRIVTEIPDDVWTGEDAPRRVAQEIARIERGFRTSVVPPLIVRSDGIWDIAEDRQISQGALDFAKAQVESSLDAIIASGGGNGLTETSFEANLIRSVLSKDGSEASLIAAAFYNSCLSLKRNIGNVYPDDSAHNILANVLYTSVEEICSEIPEVEPRIARLAELESRHYPTKEDRADLRSVAEVLEQTVPLTQRARREIEEAADVVANSENPPRVWRAILVNRLTTLGGWLDQVQQYDKRANWLIGLAKRISGWFFSGEG